MFESSLLQNYKIIEYQRKIRPIKNHLSNSITRTMKTKAPQKRITHLDLKFLDLQILSINSAQQSLISIHDHGQHSKKSKQFRTMDSTNNSQSLKHRNQSINETTDITNPDYSIFHKNQSKSINYVPPRDPACTQQLLEYLSTDVNQLKTQCSQRHQQQPQIPHETQSAKTKPVNDNCMKKSMVQKYQTQIKNIRQYNNLTHKEIISLYCNSNNTSECKYAHNVVQLKSKYKNISNHKMKVKEYVDYGAKTRREDYDFRNQRVQLMDVLNGKDYLSKKNIEYSAETNLKGSKKHKKAVKFNDNNDILKTTTMMELNRYIVDIQQQLIKNKDMSVDAFHIKDKTNSSKERILKLPMLRNNSKVSTKLTKQAENYKKQAERYKNFYELLAQEKYNTDNSHEPNNDKNQQSPGQLRENLRKRFINNSIDKSFQGYLNDKKIRIPAFLKNLR